LPIADDGANADYNALLASIQHRFSHNYTFLANYTYSHCTSEPDFEGEITGASFENPYNLRQDRGPCDFDVRHIFNASFVGASPHVGGAFWGRILGNWQFAPIIQAHTGLPLNITSGEDNSKTGLSPLQDRPNQVLLDAYNADWGPNLPQYLNGAAFTENAIGTYGNVGRNSVYTPGTFEFDAAVSRIFAITERWRLEARAAPCEGQDCLVQSTSWKLSPARFSRAQSAPPRP